MSRIFSTTDIRAIYVSLDHEYIIYALMDHTPINLIGLMISDLIYKSNIPNNLKCDFHMGS